MNVARQPERYDAGLQDVRAAGSAHIVPVHHERIQHDCEGERGDREKHAAHAQREIADRQPEQAGGERADHDHHDQRRLLQRLVEENRRVGAGREERC